MSVILFFTLWLIAGLLGIGWFNHSLIRSGEKKLEWDWWFLILAGPLTLPSSALVWWTRRNN